MIRAMAGITAARVIKKLVNRGLLKQNGKARRTNYTIAG